MADEQQDFDQFLLRGEDEGEERKGGHGGQDEVVFGLAATGCRQKGQRHGDHQNGFFMNMPV